MNLYKRVPVTVFDAMYDELEKLRILVMEKDEEIDWLRTELIDMAAKGEGWKK